MVRLADLSPEDREHLLAKECTPFETTPFAAGPGLSERRVALVTTAGLHRRSDARFGLVDTSYRVIPGDVEVDDLLMSHASVNFDRTGFQDDVNVVFPIERLRELETSGQIGAVARFHYAFMGAGWSPRAIERPARELAGLLRADAVDAVLLSPV